MIAPVAEVLTSPLVFGVLRRRLASGRATASCGPGWPGAGFSRCGLSGHVLWLRRSEHLAAAGPGGSRSAWRRWRDPRAGALAAAGLGPLGDADATEIAISVAVATVNSAAEELLWRGVFLARFPRSLIAGCLYPSVLFGLSHLGPLSVRPSKRGAAAFVAAAAALGYVYGLESTLQPVAPRHDHFSHADRCSRRIADCRIPGRPRDVTRGL
jgi:membrane protease YdiL (CAAX protease family)